MNHDRDLLQAVSEHNVERVKVLLDAGANPNALTKPHTPPSWQQLVLDGCLSVIGRPRERVDMTINAPHIAHPIPAIVLAVVPEIPESAAMAMVNMLLDHGANINAQNALGHTALIAAVTFGEKDVVNMLLCRGANVNLANRSGHTPLMIAFRANSTELVTRILREKPDVNARDQFGSTALMTACYGSNKREMAELVLQSGADPYIKDIRGNDAFDIARIYDNPDLIALMSAITSR